MKRTTVLRIALLLPCVWGRVESFFNIDTREPIIRLSPAGQNLSHFETYGEDFFGFAIALHRTEQILDGDGAQEAAAKTRLHLLIKNTWPFNFRIVCTCCWFVGVCVCVCVCVHTMTVHFG